MLDFVEAMQEALSRVPSSSSRVSEETRFGLGCLDSERPRRKLGDLAAAERAQLAPYWSAFVALTRLQDTLHRTACQLHELLDDIVVHLAAGGDLDAEARGIDEKLAEHQRIAAALQQLAGQLGGPGGDLDADP